MLLKSNFTNLLIVVALLIASATIAQNKSMHMNLKDMKTEKQSVDSSIVRKGVIDLKSIDKNNDGKVYQCPMDLNVISDVKSDCPECGMKLREDSIEDTKTKLLNKDFEVNEMNMKEHMKSETKDNKTELKIWNKVCPVMGEEVDLGAITVEYKGKTIGFCCPGCEKKFLKEPERFLKNLNEDGTKFLGK